MTLIGFPDCNKPAHFSPKILLGRPKSCWINCIKGQLNRKHSCSCCCSILHIFVTVEFSVTCVAFVVNFVMPVQHIELMSTC